MSFVILHGNDGRFRRAPVPITLYAHPVIKLQRQSGEKNHMLRTAVFDQGGFPQARISRTQRCDLHRDAKGCSAGEESGQPLRAALLARCDGRLRRSSHVASQVPVRELNARYGLAHELPQMDTTSPQWRCTLHAKGGEMMKAQKAKKVKDLEFSHRA